MTVFHSSFEMSYLWLPFIGLIIGLLSSMTGSGGGFFFLPVLILLFGIPAHIAVATSLAASLPVCMIGSLGHLRYGNVDLRMGAVFAGAGILGAILGAALANRLTEMQLKIGFGIYSLLIALTIARNNRKQRRAEKNGIPLSEDGTLKRVSKGSAYGFLAGIITGTFGTSGTAPVLAGLMSLRMPIKLVVGTSLMVSLINTFSALGAHFFVGEIDLTLVWFLAVGSIIGAYAGSKWLAGINISRAEHPIRKGYAVAMVVLGILLIISSI
jgi:uncharacterized protein